MKRFFLDYNERQIVHAAIRMDSRRGKPSPFTRRAAEAIKKARDEMDVGEVAPDVRGVIIDKIYQSIAYGTAWEYLGGNILQPGNVLSIPETILFPGGG